MHALESFYVFYIPGDFLGTPRACTYISHSTLLFFSFYSTFSLLSFSYTLSYPLIQLFPFSIILFSFTPFFFIGKCWPHFPVPLPFLAMASTCLIGASTSQGLVLRGGYCHALTLRLDT